MCGCTPLDKVLVRLDLNGGGVFPSAASGGLRAPLSLEEESACLSVAFHPIVWVATIRSRCRAIRARRAVGACPFGHYPFVVQFLYSCCTC